MILIHIHRNDFLSSIFMNEEINSNNYRFTYGQNSEI